MDLYIIKNAIASRKSEYFVQVNKKITKKNLIYTSFYEAQ